MKLNYSEEEFDKIPDNIRKMESTELDFTESNPYRDLHKKEMDRRIYYGTHFLSEYTWDGELKDRDNKDKEDNSEGGLSKWVS